MKNENSPEVWSKPCGARQLGKPLRRRAPVGEHHSLGAKFLVREIDRENWLAREYMPDHQLEHSELFYPLAGDLIGCTIN